jgi:hypothetical protein
MSELSSPPITLAVLVHTYMPFKEVRERHAFGLSCSGVGSM